MTEAPRTARARARAELVGEITAVARRQLAEQGAAALSLRAVARELGLVSSAIYRYFPSRDDLLTALIVDAYDAVGAAAEATESAPGRHDVTTRWLRLAHAVRDWARANPHEYALVYGSPVPGYAAPVDTVTPAARVSLVFLRLVAAGCEAGEIDPGGPAPRRLGPVRGDFDALRAATGAEPVPDAVVVRALAVWTQLFGHLTYELFGHLHNVIHDVDAFFELQMRQAARTLCGA